MSTPRLILASRSPRRIELLSDAGFEFLSEPADIDEEDHPSTLMPPAIAEYLAHEKARAVAERFPHDVVLGADTVVALGDTHFGKPEDAAHARWMLSQLSGSIHAVVTGVCLMQRGQSKIEVRHAVSTVSMRRLEPSEIEIYLASGDWRGKAGGYGIQDRDPFVTNTGDSTTNIVGLPMELTRQMLQNWGVTCRRS